MRPTSLRLHLNRSSDGVTQLIMCIIQLKLSSIQYQQAIVENKLFSTTHLHFHRRSKCRWTKNWVVVDRVDSIMNMNGMNHKMMTMEQNENISILNSTIVNKLVKIHLQPQSALRNLSRSSLISTFNRHKCTQHNFIRPFARKYNGNS